MLLGERRKPRLEITAPDPFVIRDASYSLINREGVEVSQGVCTIEDHALSMILEPVSSGTYFLTYTYTIAEEVLKTRVVVSVA